MTNRTQYFQLDDGALAYDICGKGPALLFIAGWPFNRKIYHKIIPALSEHFTCISIDPLGLGESRWTKKTDFGIDNHTANIAKLIEHLSLDSYYLLSFDSGGVIARQLAANDLDRAEQLILLNTDVPGERPPWLRLYKAMFRTQLGRMMINNSIGNKYVLPSRLMLKLCFEDMTKADDAFMYDFIRPMQKDKTYFEGLGRYFRGFSYAQMDSFDAPNGIHSQIKAPVSLIWGENDPTFRLSGAKKMAKNLPTLANFHVVPKTRLLLHIEQPEQVLEALFDCLGLQTTAQAKSA